MSTYVALLFHLEMDRLMLMVDGKERGAIWRGHPSLGKD